MKPGSRLTNISNLKVKYIDVVIIGEIQKQLLFLYVFSGAWGTFSRKETTH